MRTVLVLILLTAPCAAFAQHAGTPQQQAACRPDVLRFCRGIQDDFAVADCLRAHAGRLRHTCRNVIEGR
jgi:hypothetical protein